MRHLAWINKKIAPDLFVDNFILYLLIHFKTVVLFSAAAAIKGTDAIAKGAAGAGSLAGVSLALYGIYTLYCKYITLKTEKEKLRSELNTLRAEKEERATEVTTVKTKLELLSVE